MHSISAFILGEESTRGLAAGLTLVLCSQLRRRGFTHRNTSPENKLGTAGMSVHQFVLKQSLLTFQSETIPLIYL